MAVFASRKLALLFVSSLFFCLDAHGRSFTAPLGDVNDRDNEEWQYPELQPQPKFQYPQYPSNPILQTARNRVQQFVIHLVPETATVRSCVVWLISIARSTDLNRSNWTVRSPAKRNIGPTS